MYLYTYVYLYGGLLRYLFNVSFVPTARSPLFSHITATLQGLTTIRACERQEASVEYFHAYQDEQTKGWVTFLHAARWFGLRIDLVSSVFITTVVFLAIPLVNSEFACTHHTHSLVNTHTHMHEQTHTHTKNCRYLP